MSADAETMPQLSLAAIREARNQIGDRLLTTPVQLLSGPAVEAAFAAGTRAFLKLELFQRTGSFKPRGALLNVLALSEAERARGICAISAGNHAIATAYAARCLGTNAKVVMAASANPHRIEQCRLYGAVVELAADVHAGFRRVKEIQETESRAFIHPYEGLRVSLGTGTLGVEFMEQVPDLDAVVVPIGGGGLASGWVAVVPAFLAVALLLFGVREPARTPGVVRTNPIRRDNLKRLSGAYWWVVGVGAVFTLARFSEAFLVLRAVEGGIALALTPLVLVGMSVVYSLSAYPFGKLSDRVNKPRMLAGGLLVLIGADVALAMGNQGPWLWAGIALWGLHMGMTQGLIATMVAETAPEDLRGTAFGFFNLVSGIALLVASSLAGLLWVRYGASFTFMAGAAFCVIALLVLVLAPDTSTPARSA